MKIKFQEAKRRPWLLALLVAGFLISGCYIPGLGVLGDVDDPPEPGDPMGQEETLYGKFVLYQVGDSKVKKLKTTSGSGGGSIDYIVGDEVYLPSSLPENYDDYNTDNSGAESHIMFNYRDKQFDRQAARAPEARILNKQLALYFTRGHKAINGNPLKNDCVLPDPIGPDTGTSQFVEINNLYRTVIHGNTDIDVFRFQVSEPNTLVVIKVRYLTFQGGSDRIYRRRLKATLLGPGGDADVLTTSLAGMDFYTWQDPEITYVIPQALTNYYVKIEDTGDFAACDANLDRYAITFESPMDDYQNENFIVKGEIQPARSGNRGLNGGKVFSPDDLTTRLVDVIPDCDGMPGTGDEGDAGVSEFCGDYQDAGAGDGALQYQELDSRSALDDGEYFIGIPTDVPAVSDSEASIIKTPDANSLLMFVNYGDRIYMMESKDNQRGITWDISNLTNDLPSIVPRKFRGGGDPQTPVVSSNVYGFCDTLPEGDDQWAAPVMAEAAEWGGTVAGQVVSPQGYPNTPAVTQGGNNHLDSAALVDGYLVQGSTVLITTGADGVINTYFAPEYVAYGSAIESTMTDIFVRPEAQNYPRLAGPGTPDNPTLFGSNPLEALGGDDFGAYLLGDDEWDGLLFGATLPAQYLRSQFCSFHDMGLNFDKCALGAPIDPLTLDQPVSITAGQDKRLNTVTTQLRGDDYLCHEQIGDTVLVGICVGDNGVFDYPDIMAALGGDDRLGIVVHTDHILYSGLPTVGIVPGPNGVLDTDTVYANGFFDPDDGYEPPAGETGWIVMDPLTMEFFYGSDYICQTTDAVPLPAICPGVELFSSYDFNIFDISPHSRLMTLWPLYVTGMFSVSYFDATNYNVKPPMLKRDLYSANDDELCIINNKVALCPGLNGHFQSYPLYRRKVVDTDEDLFNLYDRVEDKVGKDCYSLVAERYQETWNGEEETRYVLYKYEGLRHDDEVRWEGGSGYYITTGPNGINQSCRHVEDNQRIGFRKGLPNIPVIGAGADGKLQTYALKDKKIKYDRGVYKISSGDDGIANSYALGDDKLEIFMGTGAPDFPCVLSGPDGVADTTAKGNDTQLSLLGEVGGFDSYSVFGPKAMVVDGQIRLYYTGLGWGILPYATRQSAGSLGSEGECRRGGLDYVWGQATPDNARNLSNWRRYKFELNLMEPEFTKALDNNQGVMLAPRIGVATSTMKRLRTNPADWTYRNRPVLGIGTQCAAGLDFPIDLPIDLPGLVPDVNWDGAFSPDILTTTAPDGESPLYIMFFSGYFDTTPGGSGPVKPKAMPGVARSIDGFNWQLIREMNPLVVGSEFDLEVILGSATMYATPTVIESGEDDYGEPAYTMFMNAYEHKLGEDLETSDPFDGRRLDHIGLATRKGMAYMSSCSVNSGWQARHDGVRAAVQVALFAVPLAIFVAVRISRRRRT